MYINKTFMQKIIDSPEWKLAETWGQPRPGHPEGTIGRHVFEQVIPFIEEHFSDLPEYWDLIALAYLHDIGKPQTHYENGRLSGPSHSVLSAGIADSLGAPNELIQVITLNDRAYSHWRKLLDKNGNWDRARWTPERQDRFTSEFGDQSLDLRLLVLFHRADNDYRRSPIIEESKDPVFWFENQLLVFELLSALPTEGKDRALNWQ